MKIQNRFLMLVGMAGSGKSTFAKSLYEGREDVVYLSSDELREELIGDVNNQDINKNIFDEMLTRTRNALNENKHVIYDATNISRKRRRGLLSQLPKDTYKSVVYFASSIETALKQNELRDRVVPRHVIERMYKNLQIPIYSEGWDDIQFEYDEFTLDFDFPKQFSDAIRTGVLLGREGYDLMNFLSTYFTEFLNIMDMPQDSKYHSFSVSRHTYHTYKYVLDNYEGVDESDKELMLWTALLHDTGKHYCKSFINRKGEETRYANFINHEHVSSQLAVSVLKRLGFSDESIHKVATLIQFHMYLLDEKANRIKLLDYVGEDLFEKLMFLRDADTQAH